MSQKQILVVEDEQVTAMAIASALRDFGHEVQLAAEGGEALRKAESAPFDLALLDIQLQGGVDGIEVATQIRERHGIPCVYLTAYADEQTFRRARTAHPLGYLQKPFQKDELRNTIEIALEHGKRDIERDSTAGLMQSVLDGRRSAVIIADAERRVRFMNRTAESLTGCQRDTAAGKPVGEVLKLDGGAELLENLIGRAQGSRDQGIPAVEAVLAGGKAPVEIRTAVVIDESGKDRGIYILFDEKGADAPAEAVLRPPGSGDLEAAVQRGAHKYVACYTLERLQLIKSRFGHKLAQDLLEFYSLHIAQSLLPSEQVVFWGDSSFLVLLDRAQESAENIRRTLAASVSSRLSYYAEYGTRTALLTVSGRWKIFQLNKDEPLENLTAEIKEFVTATP